MHLSPEKQTGRLEVCFPERPQVYDSGAHTVFHHRCHIVWITRYRHRVPGQELATRVRDIIRQVCNEPGVKIIKGAVCGDHVHRICR